MSQCCTFRKRIIPPQALHGAGRCYAGWKTPSRRNIEGESVWLCVSVCPARPDALAERDMAICGGQASVSAGVCVILVRIWPELPLNSSLNPPSQCGVAHGTVRLHWDRNAAIDQHKSEVSERGGRIKTSKRIQRSEVTSIAYFWWLVNHDWVCVYAYLCVCIRACVHVSISKQGTVPLGRHQLCLISDCETFPVTNTESCKTCHWARVQPHLQCSLLSCLGS